MRLAALALGLLLSAPAHAERLAVLELRGDFPPAVLGALTDVVREGSLDAVRGSDVEVMTRENMALVARDMGLDLACIEAAAECEVDIGRSIGAALIVSGGLVRIGGAVVASLRVHQTTHGVLLASRTSSAASELELVEALADTTSALIREARGEPAKQGGMIIKQDRPRVRLRDQKEVVVQFDSRPPGAVVQLDGRLLCQATPCGKSVAVGEHTVVMQLEDHHLASVTAALQRGSEVSLTLEPFFGLLRVETVPAGLEVAVDGKRRGRSPIGALRLDPGMHEVLIDDRCWLEDGQRIRIEEGAEQRLRLEARERTAGLRVEAVDGVGNALEAAILVDGQSLGLTPSSFEIPLCSREAEVTLSGHSPHHESLALTEGETHRIVASLPRGASPADAGADTSFLVARFEALRAVQGVPFSQRGSGVPERLRLLGEMESRVAGLVGERPSLKASEPFVLTGRAHLVVSRQLLNADCPAGQDTAECTKYGDSLDGLARDLLRKAVGYFGLAESWAEQAGARGKADEAAELAQEADSTLAALDPELDSDPGSRVGADYFEKIPVQVRETDRGTVVRFGAIVPGSCMDPRAFLHIDPPLAGWQRIPLERSSDNRYFADVHLMHAQQKRSWYYMRLTCSNRGPEFHGTRDDPWSYDPRVEVLD